MYVFFDDVKRLCLQGKMNGYEYNTAMADVCVLNAINAYSKGDGALMTFYKNAELEFRARALEGECQSIKGERITKSMQNLKSGILKRGTKTRFGVCIF